MEAPILTKKTLENYLIIDKPGTYTVQVAATIRPDHLINGTEPYYLVFLRLLTEDNYRKILKRLEDVTYITFLGFRKLFLSGIVFDNQIKDGFDLPTKGEEVIINYGMKDGSLQITNIELKPRYELKRIDITEIHPLLNLFKQYFNDKLDYESGIPRDENMPVPEL